MATNRKDHRDMKWVCQIALLLGGIFGALISAIECHAASETECLYWAEVAAREEGIPPALMKAIATVESGRRSNGTLAPWPWTLNFQGRGIWFATRNEAQERIAALAASGSRNMDIGCFQLNLRWHGNHFTSIGSMLEPSGNARYAAKFLRSLYREFGSWDAAAKAFHSRTPEYAEKYRKKLEPVLKQFGGTLPPNGVHTTMTAVSKALVAVQESPSAHKTHRALASLVPSNFHNSASPLSGVARWVLK